MMKKNLLDLRRSERLELARRLSTPEAFQEIAEAIERTLLGFSRVTSETEEQIYLFGVEVRQLLEARCNRELSIPPLRSHSNTDVQKVFAGGLLGLSLAATLANLNESRRAPTVHGQLPHVEAFESPLVSEAEKVIL